MNQQQRKHYDKVASIGCSLCYFVLGYSDTPCEIHHIRRAGKRDTAPVIGLCAYHHRGNGGVHGLGRRAFEKLYATTEEELLSKTLELIDAR